MEALLTSDNEIYGKQEKRERMKTKKKIN
jgi:hypothetical protein